MSNSMMRQKEQKAREMDNKFKEYVKQSYEKIKELERVNKDQEEMIIELGKKAG